MSYPKYQEVFEGPRRRIRPPQEIIMAETEFSEWFDITNKDHIAAYAYLIQHGIWPKHFIPADVSTEENWQEDLNWRIVKQYVRSVGRSSLAKGTDRV